jgi:hypothetical protein
MRLADSISNELQHAVHDVRQKVFEEAFFGRVVTAAPVMEVVRDRDVAKGFDEVWGRTREGREQPERTPERDEPDIER